MLAISGRESGGLATVDAYENYLLTVEYRWGTRTYRPRLALPKFGAIIFHAFGPDGTLRGAWLQGFRARLDENGGGDIGILRHNSPDPHMSVEVEPHVVTTLKNVDRTNYTYKPGGTPRKIEPGGFALRLGTINDVARYTPGASAGTVWERPSGEWNTLEILCVGDAIGIIFNGTLVNAASKASRTKGKFQLTTDKADIFFRTVDLRAIPRGFPTLAGMPHPSPHAALAKAIQKKSPVAAERSHPAKTKDPGRGRDLLPRNDGTVRVQAVLLFSMLGKPGAVGTGENSIMNLPTSVRWIAFARAFPQRLLPGSQTGVAGTMGSRSLRLRVPRLKTPPQIDGDLSDWRSVAFTDGLWDIARLRQAPWFDPAIIRLTDHGGRTIARGGSSSTLLHRLG